MRSLLDRERHYPVASRNRRENVLALRGIARKLHRGPAEKHRRDERACCERPSRLFENEAEASGWGTEDFRGLTPEMFANIGVPNIVYVREVLAGEIESEIGEEMNLPAGTRLYAVHAANGQRMAVLDNRDAAFAGARQYDLEPVSVH